VVNGLKKYLIAIIFILSVGSNAQGEGEKQSNIVLILLNAARADHLKAYGYQRNTTPNIDNLSKESAIFEQAIAQANWTLPSLASILTSRYVHNLGVWERGNRISEEELTLPEILKIYGYRTAAFVGGLDTMADYGLSQGFDCYYDDTADSPMNSFNETVPLAIDWLKKNKDNKFFLLVHGYDVHAPYNYPAPYEDMYDPHYSGIVDELSLDYPLLKNIRGNVLFWDGERINLTERDIGHIIAHYDAGLTYADKFIGELLAEIDRLGLWDDTTVIVTSEHGEELGDHTGFDRFGRMNLYDEVIRVPLIIKPPFADLKGKHISKQVQLIDIMPTILDLLGIPINKEAQGASLVALIKPGDVSKDFDRYAFSQTGPEKWSIRAGQWKLIADNGEYELYNLEEDEREANNLARRHPEVVYGLVRRYLDWRKKTDSGRDPDDTRIELTVEMKEKLREAGYW
jgi:arylsulfatase A-like enzyme